jgi:membrane protease YdiL (CAAX protease family)
VPGAPTTVPRWGIGDIFISLGIMLIVQIAVGVALALAGVGEAELEDPSARVTMVMIAAVWLGLLPWPLVVMFWKGSGRPDRDYGLAFKPIDIAWGIAGFVGFWVIAGIGTLIYHGVSGNDPPSNTDIVDTHFSTGALVILFLMISCLTPIIEEFWFRGFLLRAVGKRFGAPIAVVVSAVVFGAFHFQGKGWGDLWIIGLLMLYGVVLALIDVKNEGRLAPSIISHTLNNALTVVVVLGAVH